MCRTEVYAVLPIYLPTRGFARPHISFFTLTPSAHGRYSYWWSFAIAMALVNAGLEPTKLAFYDAENFS